MTETAPQIDWLIKITGSAAQSAKVQETAEQRRAMQEAVNLRLPDAERAAIRETLLGLSVKVKGVFGNKDLSVMSADGDAMAELDTVHHGAKTVEGLSAEEIAVLSKQMDKIFALQEEMKKNPAYALPDPDFPALPDDPALLAKALKERAALEAAYTRAQQEAEARLAQDLWLPLQRQGIIPENFIPQKYSAVAAQFDAASGLYEDRLQEHSAALTSKDILLEKFAFGMSLGKASLKLVTSGADLTGSIADVVGDDGVKLGVDEAKNILGYLSTALTVIDKAGTAALTDRDFTSVSDEVAGTVSDILGAQVGSDIGDMVGAAISTAARGVRTGQLLRNGDYNGAAAAMADGIASGCAGFDKSKGQHIAELGALFKLGVTSFLAGWNVDAVMSKGGSVQDVLRVMLAEFNKIAADVAKTQAGKLAEELRADAVTAVTGNKAAEEDEEEEEEEDEDEKGIGESILDRRDAQAIIGAKFDLAALDAMRAEAAEKQAEDMADLVNQGDEGFRLALITGFALPTNDDDALVIEESHRMASIDYILAEQAKIQATFDLSKAIATKGAALVVELCPGASVVTSCLTLIFSMQEAVSKAQELIIWQENLRDAQRASSAQVDAFLNRKGLQNKQTLKAGIQAALDAAKVVAEVLKMTPAAPAAPVVTASILTAEAVMEVAEIVATKVQMEAAWKVYVRARENPADRYLARQATQKNPTLAKYAMAWGATQGDPIAVEGMRRCGLNEHTLALPGTNIGKVVAYLEAQYADDPILLRAVPVKEKWHPGPVELTLRSWAGFYQMATLQAEPKLSKTSDISGINAGFDRLDEAENGFSKAVEDLMATNATRTPQQVAANPGKVDAAIIAQLEVATYTLRDMLRRFKAVDDTAKPHVEMARYIDALIARTEQRLPVMERVLDAQPWAAVSAA